MVERIYNCPLRDRTVHLSFVQVNSELRAREIQPKMHLSLWLQLNSFSACVRDLLLDSLPWKMDPFHVIINNTIER